MLSSAKTPGSMPCGSEALREIRTEMCCEGCAAIPSPFFRGRVREGVALAGWRAAVTAARNRPAMPQVRVIMASLTLIRLHCSIARRARQKAEDFMATPVKWGTEFLVNTTTASNQLAPTITALAGGRFVVAWTDQSFTGGDTSVDAVRAQVFNANGSTSGQNFWSTPPRS